MRQIELNLISQYSSKDLDRIDQVIKLNPKYQRGLNKLVQNVFWTLLRRPQQNQDGMYYKMPFPLNTTELIEKSYQITHGRLDLRQNYQTHYTVTIGVTSKYSDDAIKQLMLSLRNSNFWTIDRLLDYVYAHLFKHPAPTLILPLDSQLVSNMYLALSTAQLISLRDQELD